MLTTSSLIVCTGRLRSSSQRVLRGWHKGRFSKQWIWIQRPKLSKFRQVDTGSQVYPDDGTGNQSRNIDYLEPVGNASPLEFLQGHSRGDAIGHGNPLKSTLRCHLCYLVLCILGEVTMSSDSIDFGLRSKVVHCFNDLHQAAAGVEHVINDDNISGIQRCIRDDLDLSNFSSFRSKFVCHHESYLQFICHLSCPLRTPSIGGTNQGFLWLKIGDVVSDEVCEVFLAGELVKSCLSRAETSFGLVVQVQGHESISTSRCHQVQQ
mmetsp:Transcript_54640/g.97514  ORF Transcript_54640/g.97514 Transcript_54640/m.97514 type:complete len:264 (+) Transcript_54640:74-865(+)